MILNIVIKDFLTGVNIFQREENIIISSLLYLQVVYFSVQGVFMYLWGGQNMAKYQIGEKKIFKGDKKGGKLDIFSPIGKKYAYFSPY